jgi:twitching motility two-component system response regulator PilG
MQGQLSEIDVRSILQLIELGQRTGELFVETYPVHSVGLGSPEPLSVSQSWFVFFLNGQIVYATDAENSLTRLSDYLRRYKAESTLQTLAVSPIAAAPHSLEYGYLWALLENHILTPAQGRSILHSMVQETLFDLLSLHQGAFIFEMSHPLSPQLCTLAIGPLLQETVKQVQEWKQLHPLIQSPNQCPIITGTESLRETLPKETFHLLDRYVDGQTSIRQIARYLNKEILTVAKAIYPYAQKGQIQLLPVPPRESSTSPTLQQEITQAGKHWWQSGPAPRVLCIDDSVTIRETVEQILSQQGCEIKTIGDPLQALSLVFQFKPDLIFCDIAMPELDGYELCAMLRKSTAFRQTPLIMLTGKDGFIDRVRARMVGATDYLTKPFGADELLMLVEKYAGFGPLENRETGEPSTQMLGNLLEIEDIVSSSNPQLNQ